jgi:diacylglycerol kinase (ATP)
LNIPKKADLLVSMLLKPSYRKIDLISVGEKVYGSVAAVGFDAMVARTAQQAKGVPAQGVYIYSVFKTLQQFVPLPMKLTLDLEVYEGEFMFVAVGNSKSYGRGMLITPMAQLDDGKMDICVVHKMSKLSFLVAAPFVFLGKHTHHPKTKFFQSTTLKVESSESVPVFADGEYLQELPATFSLLPSAQKVVCV